VDVEVRESGSSVAVSGGDQVVVRVPETASAGYQWSVEEIAGPLELVSSDLELERQPAPAPGAAGERVVRLRAGGSGEGRLVLALRRPWEPTSPRGPVPRRRDRVLSPGLPGRDTCQQPEGCR